MKIAEISEIAFKIAVTSAIVGSLAMNSLLASRLDDIENTQSVIIETIETSLKIHKEHGGAILAVQDRMNQIVAAYNSNLEALIDMHMNQEQRIQELEKTP